MSTMWLVVVMCALMFGASGYLFSRWRYARLLAASGVSLASLPVMKASRAGTSGRWWQRRWVRIGAQSLAWAALFFSPLLLMIPATADAALSETFRSVFAGEVSRFVVGIMGDYTNPVNQWSRMLLGFCFFVLIVSEATIFVLDGLNTLRLVAAFVSLSITVAFWLGYDYGTSAMWGVGVAISQGMQSFLVGNTDNFFFIQWVKIAFDNVKLEDMGLWDGIKYWQYSTAWEFIAFLLEAVYWLASMWAELGYGLAKIVGVVFIPFYMLDSTRPFFDGWLRFFVGFIILNVILKATMVLSALLVRFTLYDLGMNFNGAWGEPTEVVPFAKEQLYLLADSAAALFVAVLFVLSSFVFASILASGAGSMSGALGKAANMVSRGVTKKFF
ncbi:hypothetical protein [Pseudomonas aeruginosa]|uniref:hypothetical protein n=1 Tax=Pseudomonas aeruginosa TaxID=287 RepID=UPI00136ABE71|nr:hypothetical protein [Pseudomonas aeruginosa]MYM52975.1 hypothetical protein [Pseudomonas aeruginosa]